jgi:hypothetical protein
VGKALGKRVDGREGEAHMCDLLLESWIGALARVTHYDWTCASCVVRLVCLKAEIWPSGLIMLTGHLSLELVSFENCLLMYDSY